MLLIRRTKAFTGILRSYKIFLDDRQIGVIRNGETKSFRVAPGQHTLQIKIDWFSSKPVSFVMAEKNIRFECGPHKDLLEAIRTGYFRPKEAIWLGLYEGASDVPSQAKTIPTVGAPPPVTVANQGQATAAPRYQDAHANQSIPGYLSADDYRVPDELNILYASLGIAAVVLLLLIGVSLGTVLLVIGLSAVVVLARQGQLLGHAVKVSDHQLPDVHRLAIIAAHRLSMDKPDVFVTQNPVLNAYAIGFFGKKSVILHSATVEAMDEAELLSVIGHEFSHIKCDHTNWLVITSGAEGIRVPIVSDILGFIFMFWSRKAEYTCDRGGLICCRDIKSSVSALAKLTVGAQLYKKMNLESFFRQLGEIDGDDVSKLSESLSTHPYTVKRIHALTIFRNSDTYRRACVNR